jgi:uncharacterized protein (TIGR02118 family)
MLKFIVVLHKRAEMTPAQFRNHLRSIHAPLALKLPGLRKYLHNYPAVDPTRKPPPCDAIVELYFDDRETMENAWASPQGKASDADLPLFVDLQRASWSVVDEVEIPIEG